MITTEQAIATLNSVKIGALSDVQGKTAIADAVEVAILQFQGILDTPSADLEEATTSLSSKTKEASDLTQKVLDLQKKNDMLTQQVTDLTPAVVADPVVADVAPTE